MKVKGWQKSKGFSLRELDFCLPFTFLLKLKNMLYSYELCVDLLDNLDSLIELEKKGKSIS